MEPCPLLGGKSDVYTGRQDGQHLASLNRPQYLVICMVHCEDPSERRTPLNQSNYTACGLKRVLGVGRDIDKDDIGAIFVQIQGSRRDAEGGDENLNAVIGVLERLDRGFSIGGFVASSDSDHVGTEVGQKPFSHPLGHWPVRKHDQLAPTDGTDMICHAGEKTKLDRKRARVPGHACTIRDFLVPGPSPLHIRSDRPSCSKLRAFPIL